MSKKIAVLALMLFFVTPIIGAQDTTPRAPDRHPIMHPDRETRLKWYQDYLNAPRAPISAETAAMAEQMSSVSLLEHLSYVPSERNQGNCGNCWTWAGTGVTEVALHVQNGIKDRLSLQYIASCKTDKYVCCGGNLDMFSQFYLGKQKVIPWANTNAAWQDKTSKCEYGSSTVACNLIATSPNYGITSMTPQTITTINVANETAISNVKNVLAQNKAVYFAFTLPNKSDWDQFFSFWDYQGESVLINYDYASGHYWVEGEGGGHAVLIVGYVDNGGTDRYWIVLNSWGAPSGRPNGLFHLDMNMNYNAYFIDPSDSKKYAIALFQTMNIGFSTGGGGTGSAQVVGLSSVDNAQVGGTAAFVAQVKNTGTSALPSNAAVWFYVQGPGVTNNWVGSASVGGLAAGGTQSYAYNWSIPSSVTGGSYKYWAKVYQDNTEISGWSSEQAFTISTGGGGSYSAAIPSLYTVSGATVGGTAKLWAQVQNTCSMSLPSNAVVWFWVSGISNNWVGSASTANLAAGSSNWYSYDWAIPSNLAAGTYTYWAKVYAGNTEISGWSSGQAFAIAGGGGTSYSAKILSLWPIGTAYRGGSVYLWASVQNTGSAALPSNAAVFFAYQGGSMSAAQWAGGTYVSGLSPGSYNWFYYPWAIPTGLSPGYYYYWARVYIGNDPISEWSSGQTFYIY